MKGILLTDPKTGSDIVIDMPTIMPSYSIGTDVSVTVMDKDDMIETFVASVIGIEIAEDMNLDDNTITTDIGYRVMRHDTNGTYNVNEADITEYYAETNEYDVGFYIKD